MELTASLYMAVAAVTELAEIVEATIKKSKEATKFT
jgi:hypothetical protein